MATLPITISKIKEITNLQDISRTDALESHFSVALRWLAKYTNEDDYAAVTDGTDTDAARADSFQMAFAYVVVYYALPLLNMKTVGDGIVRTTGSLQNQVQLLSNDEIKSMQNQFRQNALEMLEPYLNRAGQALRRSLNRTGGNSQFGVLVL